MGGRGSSSGFAENGKKYGTEYSTLLQRGNIKFLRYNDSSAAKTPMETMSKGRIYVTVNADDELKAVTFYDKKNKRYKQIDITGKKHTINGEKKLPHTHFGYVHDEHGTKDINERERALIDKIKKLWHNRESR